MYKVYKLFNNDLEYYGITKLTPSQNLSLLKSCTDNKIVNQIIDGDYEYSILNVFETRDEAKQYKAVILNKDLMIDKKEMYKQNYKNHITTFREYYQINKDKIKQYNKIKYIEKKEKMKEMEEKLKVLELNQ